MHVYHFSADANVREPMRCLTSGWAQNLRQLSLWENEIGSHKLLLWMVVLAVIGAVAVGVWNGVKQVI